MKLSTLKPNAGSRASKKRRGRGNASGHGTYSTRGCKGQGQRKSGNVRRGFEGGQTPIIMRLPKLRGFKNVNRVSYQVINVSDLNTFKDGDEVNMLTLLEKGLISKKQLPVKVLATGKLEKKLSIRLHKMSDAAKAKVVAAGGKVL
jgi:large subunit ribosomal protein L15